VNCRDNFANLRKWQPDLLLLTDSNNVNNKNFKCSFLFRNKHDYKQLEVVSVSRKTYERGNTANLVSFVTSTQSYLS